MLQRESRRQQSTRTGRQAIMTVPRYRQGCAWVRAMRYACWKREDCIRDQQPAWASQSEHTASRLAGGQIQFLTDVVLTCRELRITGSFTPFATLFSSPGSLVKVALAFPGKAHGIRMQGACAHNLELGEHGGQTPENKNRAVTEFYVGCTADFGMRAHLDAWLNDTG